MSLPIAQRSDGEPLSAVRGVMPGILLAAVLAMAAGFIAEHHGGPQLLYALLLGMAFNAYAGDPRTAAGLGFAASSVLRIGVALLGVRVTVGEVATLGWNTFALVASAVASTLLVGWMIARSLKVDRAQALVSAGAVAICGASAALAIAAALPRGSVRDTQTALTVGGVAALGSLAMVLYPVLAQAMALDPRAAGIFLGATIHDVAQAVGAAHMLSEQTANVATVVKLMRVALLAPVIIAIGWLYRGQREAGTARRPVVPPFLLSYVALLLVNSAGLVPAPLAHATQNVSVWCLSMAVAALGTRICVRELVATGLRPLLAMCAQSAWLLLIVGGWLWAVAAVPTHG